MTINLVAIQKIREQIAEKQSDITNYNEMLNDATEDILYLEYALNELLEPDVPPDDDRASIIARDLQVPGILNY